MKWKTIYDIIEGKGTAVKKVGFETNHYFFQFLQNENNGFSHVSRTFHLTFHTHILKYIYIYTICYLFGSLVAACGI